ncbi:6-pyruvoyl trahydropterin synthase family protein [Sulfuracidifex metallicus]|jgi:6-pyruvoyltetrahydropterin/6-carboxytetrahydropterin synthase|uniref:6-pyruvoyl tetrahydrobiopterin synthase n=1 Tax=Sulfuracidifex metallicus DSM 6482 = JCM 9184 TaxID=523847 RepID=A0A6A9QVZ4_SULME|nr:6-carboxytetrahydropterin synthase [Sulfuracidifex metallicus]MUN29222.1 6-pyruvoyl tetrahydrobiopterin synthase [Sulfuracidifex metallicus DSM 6482 = JCM 9184]WOE50259.1 6-carboxytetrahydropterin synthase [Sulfuracidifex metallicus DSM 6482 = JCM 9184]
MKIKIGIEGFTIDSAHYTPSSPGNEQIHGHTYELTVEVQGNVDEKSGFVIDFDILREVIYNVVKEYDHKIIIPRKDISSVELKGPFSVLTKTIDHPFATVEYIGQDIAKEIYEKLEKKFNITLRISEGKDSYAVIEYP